jgi:hypothetical protein
MMKTPCHAILSRFACQVVYILGDVGMLYYAYHAPNLHYRGHSIGDDD